MIATGDWIVPRLNGVRYFEKPVMGYWLNGLAMLVFGENPFAARFPSAMAAGLSALMVWLLMRRLGGGTAAAASWPHYFSHYLRSGGNGRLRVLDGMLALFITMAMTAFYWAATPLRGSWQEKGPAGAVRPVLRHGVSHQGVSGLCGPGRGHRALYALGGRWRDLFRMAGIPIVAATLIALPWAIAIHLKEPDSGTIFSGMEHVRRFLAEDAQHEAPFWIIFWPFP